MVADLAHGLDPQRYLLHAWFLGGAGPHAAILRRAGARVRVLDWWRGVRDPLGAFRFWRAVKAESLSIIHQHFGGRSVRWLARRAAGARVVVHIHGRVSEPNDVPRPLFVSGADEVIANSRALARQVTGARPCVVYPGLHVLPTSDGRSSSSGAAAGIIIGTAARLVPVKGLAYLLRALALLRSEFPDLCLEIAGSGPGRTALEHEVQLLGLTGSVSFLGWRTDLESIMTGWDVFALPSLDEGFGMAALEAMAAELPVVASAVGGLLEIVEDGRTGYLVPPRDPAGLAERLRALLVDPALRGAMGAAGQARAREVFSTQRMIDAILEIYERLLEGRSTVKRL